MRYTGTVWRHIPVGAHPLHAHYILHAGGRWNQKGEYGALYTSLSEGVARAEWGKRQNKQPRFQRSQRDVVTIQVDVEPVADLTDPSVRNQLGLSVTPSEMTNDSSSDYSACRQAADRVRSHDYNAVLVPAAVAVNGANLIIYLDGKPKNIHLTEGYVRKTI